jgi:Ca2+-binding EF-hand superfamily protein
MKKIITILSALAVSVSFATAADEANKGDKPKRDPEAAFKKWDSNNDGKLTKEEFMASPMAKKDAAKAETMFGKKDKDSSGDLSLDEFKAPGGRKDKGAGT